jgi:hypothetical protein
MKTITMDAQFVRAAQACQAKKDVRYYLNGICIMPQGKIAGTNGHILYTGQYTEDADNMVVDLASAAAEPNYEEG